MSEIYLTKIERKTIFTKSLIFVLIMFIISDLTVTGPFWFNFIPWLYILGTVGSLKKIDSALMVIIGTFTVFIASTISMGGVCLTSIIDTMVALSCLVLGIITGKILYEFVLEYRLVKYIRRSKKTIYILLVILMFFISYLVVGLSRGNIVTYLKSRANLKDYITETYNMQNYDILQTKYNNEVPGKYTYVVKMNGQEIYFVPYTDKIFTDANKDTRLINASRKLYQEVVGKTETIVKKYSTLTKTTANFKLEFDEYAIVPNVVVMIIDCNYDEKNKQEKVYEELASCIKELQTVKETDKVVLNINDRTMHINHNKLEGLDKNYIKGGFQVEELSE